GGLGRAAAVGGRVSRRPASAARVRTARRSDPCAGRAGGRLMQALVTGASGFVGAAVVRALLADGHQVRVLLRAQSNRRNIAGLEVTPVIGDLADVGALQAALQGCEALFHVAADYRLWTPDPEV